jgi:hypothetical protein
MRRGGCTPCIYPLSAKFICLHLSFSTSLSGMLWHPCLFVLLSCLLSLSVPQSRCFVRDHGSRRRLKFLLVLPLPSLSMEFPPLFQLRDVHRRTFISHNFSKGKQSPRLQLLAWQINEYCKLCDQLVTQYLGRLISVLRFWLNSVPIFFVVVIMIISNGGCCHVVFCNILRSMLASPRSWNSFTLRRCEQF